MRVCHNKPFVARHTKKASILTSKIKIVATNFILHLHYSLYEIKDPIFPANIYLLNINDRNTGKRYKISSKLAVKTSERKHHSCQLCAEVISLQ